MDTLRQRCSFGCAGALALLCIGAGYAQVVLAFDGKDIGVVVSLSSGWTECSFGAVPLLVAAVVGILGSRTY